MSYPLTAPPIPLLLGNVTNVRFRVESTRVIGRELYEKKERCPRKFEPRYETADDFTAGATDLGPPRCVGANRQLDFGRNG